MILCDADRAEDITQEVFISALRRLRDTERPIAFKPWIYQIAKNAGIDELRRTRRSLEVPLDSQRDRPGGDDRSALARSRARRSPSRASSSSRTCAARFRGVSDLHLRVLVLRELEGLSYREIGERLGMSRPVVESTLFRARRRLAEEYEELISGRRCERTRALIDAAGADDPPPRGPGAPPAGAPPGALPALPAPRDAGAAAPRDAAAAVGATLAAA